MYAPTTPLPELIRRWQAGWGTARGLAAAVEARGGLHVVHGEPDRHTESIALHAEEDLDSVRSLAEATAAASVPTWCTVPTRHPEVVATILTEAGLVLGTGIETLMTAELESTAPLPAPDPYRATFAVRPTDGVPVIEATVRHPSRTIAARGLMAVHGSDAVAHSIETRPAHRRRGLASVVMSTLIAEAVRLGATTGLLVASSDGERLYSALGWSAVATVLVASTPPKHRRAGAPGAARP
ncbi:GNAT family N-acetyltransferase [Actinoalloteichus hymeniacidonis]|uniref:FR47-like protein n=1 Tax=Actinoalloteichus hymeniacidonis TaxID=340345 RepID=A0AAC9HQK4_9PSEU|nr:GNAT family N-acetyltransferase [Actinoalloteichus hymeniacidonis]AOS63476.1 FR47-like protein [Actinoalloteichus hymeniacidonis]MBB5908481.1 GNAT superfamily N-acetyltransferase [Actinoalloteichus hymeniacidonis]